MGKRAILTIVVLSLSIVLLPATGAADSTGDESAEHATITAVVEKGEDPRVDTTVGAVTPTGSGASECFHRAPFAYACEGDTVHVGNTVTYTLTIDLDTTSLDPIVVQQRVGSSLGGAFVCQANVPHWLTAILLGEFDCSGRGNHVFNTDAHVRVLMPDSGVGGFGGSIE